MLDHNYSTMSVMIQHTKQKIVPIFVDERCSELVGKMFVIEIQTRKITSSSHLNISISLLNKNRKFTRMERVITQTIPRYGLVCWRQRSWWNSNRIKNGATNTHAV